MEDFEWLSPPKVCSSLYLLMIFVQQSVKSQVPNEQTSFSLYSYREMYGITNTLLLHIGSLLVFLVLLKRGRSLMLYNITAEGCI
jgi:hypothetical protein